MSNTVHPGGVTGQVSNQLLTVKHNIKKIFSPCKQSSQQHESKRHDSHFNLRLLPPLVSPASELKTAIYVKLGMFPFIYILLSHIKIVVCFCFCSYCNSVTVQSSGFLLVVLSRDEL